MKDEDALSNLRTLAFEKVKFNSQRIKEYELFQSEMSKQQKISRVEYRQTIQDPKLNEITKTIELNDEIAFQHSIKMDELKRKGNKPALNSKFGNFLIFELD